MSDEVRETSVVEGWKYWRPEAIWQGLLNSRAEIKRLEDLILNWDDSLALGHSPAGVIIEADAIRERRKNG